MALISISVLFSWLMLIFLVLIFLPCLCSLLLFYFIISNWKTTNINVNFDCVLLCWTLMSNSLQKLTQRIIFRQNSYKWLTGWTH
jgi:hypothetical protein